ncbi:hypothetical protein [Campylobacter sp. US33a]|uniref:hypothetical protein n=1 Tax=Campylobacter sp. US33a TaxID=2498120 RepID=UPI001067A9BF|nr:hypothetical protein [Campylobacter sp. US33a]TEY00728.1 hypothetical protein ELQ16_08825 [Campylobacter sp. US33a]
MTNIENTENEINRLKKLILDLRRDNNVLSQHLLFIRQNFQEKIETLANTANKTEIGTRNVLGGVLDKLENDEAGDYARIIEKVIREDNEESRNKLFEDIERYIEETKLKHIPISYLQWCMNGVFVFGLIAIIAVLLMR